MKIIITVSVLLVVFVLILPVFMVKGELAEPELYFEVKETEAAIPPPVVATQDPSKPEGDTVGTDMVTNVRVLIGDSVVVMTMYDYLVGVVSAEMPASFYEEALKAQAVAARTYTYYKILNGSNHNNADICSNHNCCKAYLSYDELKEKWGEKFDFFIYIINKAVSDTDGICVTYASEPILAAFHSSSSGYTEDSQNVWHSPLPYLVSVESPEGGVSVPNYNSEVIISFEELKATVKKSYPAAVFDESLDSWISDVVYSESGRIISLQIGGVEMTGTELRALFGLRSAAATWGIEDGGIRFKVTGYGHGVGMSQYGANEFARNGADYKDILEYYYQGTRVENYILLSSEKRLL